MIEYLASDAQRLMDFIYFFLRRLQRKTLQTNTVRQVWNNNCALSMRNCPDHKKVLLLPSENTKIFRNSWTKVKSYTRWCKEKTPCSRNNWKRGADQGTTCGDGFYHLYMVASLKTARRHYVSYQCLPVSPPRETLSLPRKKKCFLRNSETFLLRKHCFLVYPHVVKCFLHEKHCIPN